MSTQPVLVCKAFTAAGDGSLNCTQQAWAQAYVVPPEAAAQIELLIQGGFDSETFLEFFGGTLLMFAVGLGVGLVISMIRKTQRF
ncbi:TPA: hypothetical protein MNK97_005285 [Klebsiella pneumoniae]|nr:hypothetical protein [Klebsiella pneumoniae]